MSMRLAAVWIACCRSWRQSSKLAIQNVHQRKAIVRDRSGAKLTIRPTRSPRKLASTLFVVKKKWNSCNQIAKQLMAMLKSPWVNYFVKHDPAKTLANVKCHVLALNGEKDLQMLCELNLIPIEKAQRAGSPASFEVVRFPNLNHMFQETKGSGMPTEYGQIEETFSPKALKVIGDWIKNVIK